jgi:hypothetical protein
MYDGAACLKNQGLQRFFAAQSGRGGAPRFQDVDLQQPDKYLVVHPGGQEWNDDPVIGAATAG